MGKIRSAVLISFLVVLGLAVAVQAQAAPAGGNDPTKVATYGASALAAGVHASQSDATVWGKYDAIWGQELKAIRDFISSSKQDVAVSVQVALPNPDSNQSILMGPYQIGGATFGLSLEIATGSYTGYLKGVQKFKSPVEILLTSKSPKPFVLSADKKPIYLDDIVNKMSAWPDFDGKVVRLGTGTYRITVNAWRAGDPCFGG